MKSILTILLVGLLTMFVATHAAAWEFKLTGTWLWGYDYIDQAGGAGFFGPHNVASTGLSQTGQPKVNAMNAWVGARTINGTHYGMVTGADASLQWSRMELMPEIRVNNAIRFRAAYQIGNSAVTEYGLYANSTAPGAWNPIATGQWTQWWMEAQTPWGVLVAGKRDLGGYGAPIRSESRYYRVSQFGRPVWTFEDRLVLLSLAWSGLVEFPGRSGRDQQHNSCWTSTSTKPSRYRNSA